ncbi:MAG TPA: hypothetical protein VJ371_23370 [Streptosporangiaceae bacterium]|nr:hypothetical protein [Streptosporangiaceae bacterium]
MTAASPHHSAGYLTVYLTVLLVSPFPGPTVAVTRFSGTQERDRPRDTQRHIRRQKRCRLMTCTTVTLVIAAFLSGAVIAVFAMLAAAIRAGDRTGRLTDGPHGQLQALIRSMVGLGVRTGAPASDGNGEKD